MFFLNKYRQYLLVLLSLLLLSINFIPGKKIKSPEDGYKWEKFNPELSRINSIDKLIGYTDSLAAAKNISDSLEYWILLHSVLQDRFYHGYSNYSPGENWIAAYMGFAWTGFSSIVIPDDIMKQSHAACSQQGIVLMKVFKSKGVDYRKVGFDHHFAVEGFIKNRWHYFDPNLEASVDAFSSRSITDLAAGGNLASLYKHVSDTAVLNHYLSKNFEIGEVNDLAGETAYTYQLITKLLSKTAWLFPLPFLFLSFRRSVMYVSASGFTKTRINRLVRRREQVA